MVYYLCADYIFNTTERHFLKFCNCLQVWVSRNSGNFVQSLTFCVVFFQHNVRCGIVSVTAPNVFNQPANLIDYFYLNPFTCLLTLRESLVTIGVTQVEMLFSATDNGLPNLSSNINARFTLTIIRNENDPFFVNTPYVTTIPETTALGTVVITVTARDNDDLVCTTSVCF